jgi:3-deoxy-D-manno-octulosonate 8-phosphate phosphatase KdsC-like HAD superfamily phosphatase
VNDARLAAAGPEVVPLAHWVLTRRGGYDCVREFCDAVWRAKAAA